MTFQDAMKSAIGLAWSEHHRWKDHDPKTGDHWAAVATALTLESARRNTQSIRDMEAAGERVTSEHMNFTMRSEEQPRG